MTQQTTLISYALDFVSFLMDSAARRTIRKIILFGSVARGDFTEKSDIDLFIDAPLEQEKLIEKTLDLFRSSQRYKSWVLRGITNELSLKIGTLDAWSLKREVISSGILLYGKYHELPKNVRYYLLIRITKTAKRTSHQVRLWRALYGYTQKVGKKQYIQQGALQKSQGMRLGKGAFIVPMEQRKPILDLLKKHKVSYALHELWSDTF